MHDTAQILAGQAACRHPALRTRYGDLFLLIQDSHILDASSLKDVLKRLPTPETLDGHPLTDCLTASHLSQHPERAGLGRGELLGWFLASLWREHFMPKQIAPEFAREWNHFLVLEVGFFYPFRKARRLNGKLAANAFPKGLAQIGALLADDKHLTEILSDPYQSALNGQSDWHEQILAAIVPNPNDPMKGAIPITTVASRRDSALADLADLLNTLHPVENEPVERLAETIAPAPTPSNPAHQPAETDTLEPAPNEPAHQLTETDNSEPAPSEPAHQPTETDTLELTPATEAGIDPNVREPVHEHVMALDHYLVIDWWVKDRLQQTEAAGKGVGLANKSRRLAEYLAAIQLKVESGSEATTRLVLSNVRRSMRGIGVEPERDDAGDVLIGVLERAQLLVAVDNYWEFSHPNLVDYFGARYITEYGQHWVSLKPRHRRLMRWAAACLARRGDDERVKVFVTDLKVLLNHAAELSWLEVGEVIVELSGNRTVVTDELRCQLIEALHRLSAIKSVRLRHAVDNIAQRLGVDIGPSNVDAPVEEIISEAEMEQAANQTGLAGLLLALGISAPARVSGEDTQVVRVLLEHLQTPGGHMKLACAAWLRRSSLHTRVSFNINLKALWNSGLISALEAIADIAIDERQDAFTRMLARSILTKDDFILRLWASDQTYQPLVYTLLIALDKRLFFRMDTQQWQLVK